MGFPCFFFSELERVDCRGPINENRFFFAEAEFFTFVSSIAFEVSSVKREREVKGIGTASTAFHDRVPTDPLGSRISSTSLSSHRTVGFVFQCASAAGAPHLLITHLSIVSWPFFFLV